MEVRVLGPELGEFDAGSQELQAAFAALQRAFRPGKGRGNGGKPSDATGRPGSLGGAKGIGKGGAFAGRYWKCNEIGHRTAACPRKAKNASLQAVSETGTSQPASDPPPSSPDEWAFAEGLLEIAPERPARATTPTSRST
eukprot:11155826-Alexandrium_andersonii.AAC.1